MENNYDDIMMTLTNNRCVNFILMILTDITNLHCSLNKVSWEREYGDIIDYVPVKLTLYQYKNSNENVYQNNLEITKDAILKELEKESEEKKVKFNSDDTKMKVYLEEVNRFRIEQVINLEIGELL